MADPDPDTALAGIVILCPECGDAVEVKDPIALIRALHIANECSVRTLLTKQE